MFGPLVIYKQPVGDDVDLLARRPCQPEIQGASAFDRQVNSSVKLFTRALPPVLIIVMAIVGSFVLAAILLPLMELQSAVR